MTELILKLCIKDRNDKSPNTRQKFSNLSGIVGIICNFLLTAVKFVIGSVTNSVSITADAANNLSDATSNIVTIVGAKLANKPVDDEHPFGHGRLEYVSALIVSFFIFLMGFELGKSSFIKILHPEDVKFSPISLIILIIAILVKLWMAFFNNKLFKITQNVNMKAVRQDSLNDSIATGATIIALLISSFTPFKRADGVIGLIVAVIIVLSGIGIVKDILNPLLGQTPNSELVSEIERIMLEEDLIVGVHDLIVHDYGPGRIIASAHAEVPSDIDIMDIHDVIDNVEKEIQSELKIVICIHMDPIVVNDEKVNKYRDFITDIIHSYDEKFSFHDFRVVDGPTHTNLIFDLVIPAHDNKDTSVILKDIRKLVAEKDNTVFVVATVENSYV